MPAHAYSGDDGMVKFTLGGKSFTISLESLDREGPIWYEDLGVFITKANDPTTFAQYGEASRPQDNQPASAGASGQSLAGAHNGQPRRHVDNYNLGCAGRRSDSGWSPTATSRCTGATCGGCQVCIPSGGRTTAVRRADSTSAWRRGALPGGT